MIRYSFTLVTSSYKKKNWSEQKQARPISQRSTATCCRRSFVQVGGRRATHTCSNNNINTERTLYILIHHSLSTNKHHESRIVSIYMIVVVVYVWYRDHDGVDPSIRWTEIERESFWSLVVGPHVRNTHRGHVDVYMFNACSRCRQYMSTWKEAHRGRGFILRCGGPTHRPCHPDDIFYLRICIYR